MSRIDPTFNPGDIIRFWCNNLTNSEQNEVVVFFWLLLPGIMLDNKTIAAIFDLISELTGSRIQKILIKVLIAYIKLLRRISNTIWAEVIFNNEETKKEVIKCINKRLKIVNKP